MSDIMLLGVLRMPLTDDPSELDVMTWIQFRNRAREAAGRIESDADELARLRAEVESLRLWRAAIDEACALSHLNPTSDTEPAHEALNRLLAWHQAVALDPAVSAGARELIERGRGEALRAGAGEAVARIWREGYSTEVLPPVGTAEAVRRLDALPDGTLLYTTPPPSAPAALEGWKLVPVEPTDDMKHAANACYRDNFSVTSADLYRAMLAAAPSPADQPPRTATFRARPVEWDQDSSAQWTDRHYGFSIIEEQGDELPFSAAWGEDDAEQFATLEEAKTWCQAQIDSWIAKYAVIVAPVAAVRAEKIAPVQGWPSGIPWSLHLEAYAAYCAKWGPQPALIDLEGRNCRGGFGMRELDEFIPGWRDKVSEIGRLRAELAQLREGANRPIHMVLHCPACGLQHIDAPDELAGLGCESIWDNPPHRSHLCHGCGHIWRPADVPTNGVEAVRTKGKSDSPAEKP